MDQYKARVPIRWLCDWTGMSKSSWYYTPREGKPGACATTHTHCMHGSQVENAHVVDEIKTILSEEHICYGYEKVTWELHDLGYIINKKKVYRLMKEAHLLNSKHRIATAGKRRFVQHRTIQASFPLEYLVMDIKYVWIHGERRNAYLLTVLDVFSRKVIAHCLKPSIKQQDVILLIDGIVQGYQTKGITIRNDNGSQFLAHSVRKYLQSKDINQEFTHVATPQENAYIEALHSVLEKELIRRYYFDSIHYARWKIDDYYQTYNNKRKHRSLKRKTPQQIWNHFFNLENKNKNQSVTPNPTNCFEFSVPKIRG